MEENLKRSHTKSRQELFKEFVIPKISEKLEKMRSDDAEYKGVVKNEFSYSEQKQLLQRLSKTNDFKKSIEHWKKEFDKAFPTEEMKQSEATRRKLEEEMGLNKTPVITFELY